MRFLSRAVRAGTPRVACGGVRRAARVALSLCTVASLLLLAACAMHERASGSLPWSASEQLVLVLVDDWNSSRGTLGTYERGDARWQAVGERIPVVIGRAGAAWGLGLHPAQAGPRKREGDGRSPAGVFAIGTAFGYAPHGATALPYDALQPEEYCVDVSGSPLYNRIVDAAVVGSDAVRGSTEPMRRDLHAGGDPAYKIGFVVEHNAGGMRDAGSCIFVHLWKSPDSGTAGCTAMAEPELARLLAWLQPQRHPVFVLLPRAEYRRLRAAWQLPDLERE